MGDHIHLQLSVRGAVMEQPTPALRGEYVGERTVYRSVILMERAVCVLAADIWIYEQFNLHVAGTRVGVTTAPFTSYFFSFLYEGHKLSRKLFKNLIIYFQLPFI